MSLEATETPALAEEHTPGEPRPARGWLGRLVRNPAAVVCAVFLGAVIVIGVLGPLLEPHPVNEVRLDAVNAPPGTAEHLLGGDGSGRDILSRLIGGTQVTLFASVVMLGVALVVGVPAGLLGGYRRGIVENVLNWLFDIVMTLPGVVLLIALYTRTGPNLTAAMAVFGVLIAPSYYRLVRGLVLGVRNELYIDAAKSVGLSDLRIIGRHVLWAVRAPIIIQSSFVLGAGIAIQAAVGFLGLGDPAVPSWGSMLQESFANIYNNGWSVVWPATLISLTILALVLLGTAFGDALEAKDSGLALSSRARGRLRVSLVSRQDAPVGDAGEAGDLLSVRGLTVAYPGPQGDGVEVVRGVDLEVRTGEVHGLVGESGSGKTQTAFSILGLLAPEAIVVGGSVSLRGVDLLADPEQQRAARGRRIAYVPQEPMSNLDPCFTVGSQLARGLRAVKNVSRSQAKTELLALLDRVGIKDPARVYDMYPHQISGGMAQRILICGAVAGDPELIIADEPTTALDVTVQAEVLDLLRELRDERGLGMVLVTHDLGVVADLCDTVSVMKDGEIVEVRNVRDLFADPRHPYTVDLLASSRAVELAEVGSRA